MNLPNILVLKSVISCSTPEWSPTTLLSCNTKYNKENKIDDFEVIFPRQNRCRTSRILYQNVANLSLCTFIIPSMRCRTSSVSLGAVVFRPLTLSKNLYQTQVRKCNITLPKSGRNLSSLLSIVGYIFFNLFLVVHLRKRSNTPPKIACF